MNIPRLREMHPTLQALAAELDATLLDAEKSRDPLAAHIYRARIAYERACQLDQSKAQKRVEWEINSLLESDEQRVRFCRKCSGGVSVAA